MKKILLLVSLSLFLSFKSNENSVVGVYENHCGDKLEIHSDSTYRFTYPVVNHFENWTIGSWKFAKDKLILEGSIVYDSIVSELRVIPNADSTATPKYSLEPLEEYQTVVSNDSISDRIDGYEARTLGVIFSRIRQSTDFTDTLLVTGKGLKRIRNSINSECKELIKRNTQ